MVSPQHSRFYHRFGGMFGKNFQEFRVLGVKASDILKSQKDEPSKRSFVQKWQHNEIINTSLILKQFHG